MRKHMKAAAAVMVATALALTGCTGDTTPKPTASTVSKTKIEKAMDTPTELLFWTWAGDFSKQVAAFEKKYPKIHVKVENVGQGGAHYQALRTALKAGKGLPDIVQMEYQYISSFELTDSLLDLAPYGGDDLKDLYAPWLWDQVTSGKAVYGIPQDTGPLGVLYRTDILDKAGVSTPPTTWEEFTAVAEAVHATGSYLTNLAPNDPGEFVALLWASGIHPFGYDGKKTVRVDLATKKSHALMDYWQKLIDEKLVSVDPDFTDEWYQSLANGTYASWITAAWGPLFLQGTAAKTSGLWEAAPMPMADPAKPTNGNWGGSANSVLAASKNPIAAFEFAKYLNTDSESALSMANDMFLFPAMTKIQKDPSFADQKSEFYGGQKVNAEFAKISETVDTDFQWLPFMDFVYSSFTDTLGAAMEKSGDLNAGLDAWQKAVVDYAKAQGFTVG